jgi:hypothetical protein
MLTKKEILVQIEINKDKILSYGVNKLALFGSYAKGLETITSDIDFLVEFHSKMKTYDNFMELAFFISDLFDKKVEIITPESLNSYMLEKIMKESEYVISN